MLLNHPKYTLRQGGCATILNRDRMTVKCNSDFILRAGATGGVLGVQTPTASCFIILYNIYPFINGHPLSEKSLLGHPLPIKHGAGHDTFEFIDWSLYSKDMRLRIIIVPRPPFSETIPFLSLPSSNSSLPISNLSYYYVRSH